MEAHCTLTSHRLSPKTSQHEHGAALQVAQDAHANELLRLRAGYQNQSNQIAQLVAATMAQAQLLVGLQKAPASGQAAAQGSEASDSRPHKSPGTSS